MDRNTLIAEHQAVVDAHGPWGSHNVALPLGVFTIGPEPKGDNHRAVKFLRLATDLLKQPLPSLRVLDLACGEGLYAIEFARQGCEVVAVEARAQHVAKAEFAKRVLGLDNLTILQGDVRAVTRESHGAFDLILCSGILYHLDAPDVFPFLGALKGMCRGALVIDSRVAMGPEVEVTHQGRPYHGLLYREHRPGASEAERLADGGASIDNEASFWFTRASLANCLADIGFTSVVECWMPRPLVIREDRATFVAIPGRPVAAFNEIASDLEATRWPMSGAAPVASAAGTP